MLLNNREKIRKFRVRKKKENFWKKWNSQFSWMIDDFSDIYSVLLISKLKKAGVKVNKRNLKRTRRFHYSNKETHRREIELKEFRKKMKELKQ